MQLVASFEAIHLTGINSQAALHGADTETMIGSNAPTRIKTTSGYSSVRQVLASPESESTDETIGRYSGGD
jgi:hypothetical protein